MLDYLFNPNGEFTRTQWWISRIIILTLLFISCISLIDMFVATNCIDAPEVNSCYYYNNFLFIFIIIFNLIVNIIYNIKKINNFYYYKHKFIFIIIDLIFNILFFIFIYLSNFKVLVPYTKAWIIIICSYSIFSVYFYGLVPSRQSDKA